MGELSQRIGKKLEKYGNTIFNNLEWEILTQDLQFNCMRPSHKNPKNKEKTTHGIDLLQGYYNPFTDRKESIIIECKHREWSNFIPSNLKIWIEELINTIECASLSPSVNPYLGEYTLVGGMLLYNSSDNKYELTRALENISKIDVPRRRNPMIIYLADNNRLEKWYSFNQEISKIKSENRDNNWGIIYPSIGGSHWERLSVVTPSYLFSDYIITTYTKTNELEDGIKKDIKAIFCFDKVNEDSLIYLRNMINELQLESRSDRKQEFNIYYYPESAEEIDYIKECFSRFNKDKQYFKLNLLDNRRLSRISYE